MRLLVTRPEPEATALALELQAAGHDTVVHPLIAFEALAFDVSAIGGAKTIIVTSPSSLRAAGDQILVAGLSNVRLFCVGMATATKASAMGFRNVMPPFATASRLAEQLDANAAPQPVVHLSGEHQAFDLTRALAEKGLPIRTYCVYSMRARRALDPLVADMIRWHRIDGVFLMSPRTAAIYSRLCVRADIVREARDLTCFCMSQAIAARLGPLSPREVRVAKAPDRPSLLALVKSGME